jgi:hypothetical protein
MSTLTSPATWQWPADVVAFAQQRQVAVYLDPVLAATRALFPTMHDLRVTWELDPGIPDEWYLVFDVYVPKADVPDFVAAVHRWSDETRRICPMPQLGMFRLFLHRVAA